MEKCYSFSFKISDLNYDNIKQFKFVLDEYKKIGIEFLDLVIDEHGIYKVFRKTMIRKLAKIIEKLKLRTIITLDLDLNLDSPIQELRLAGLRTYDEILKRTLAWDPEAIILKTKFNTYPWEDLELYYLKKEILLNSLAEIKIVTSPIFLAIEPKVYNYFEIQIIQDISDLLGLGFAIKKSWDPEFETRAFYLRDRIGEVNLSMLELF